MAQAFLQEIIKKQTSAGEMVDFLFSNGDKLGCGKYPPKFARQGEYYEYGIIEKGAYKNLAPGTFKAIDKPVGIAAPAPVAIAASSSGRSGNTQQVISRQAAANTALAFVNLLQSADALPIPKTIKSDQRADLIEQILRDYMNKFHMWSTHEPFDFGAAQVMSDLGLKEMEDTDWQE